MKLVLDAGHGGHDSGAVSPRGLKESDKALEIVLGMRDILADYPVEVMLTRETDLFVSLTGRASMANSWGADLFLSVHCNAGPPGQGWGHEVWTSKGKTKSDAFASALFHAFFKVFPGLPARKDMSDGDPDKESDFTVLTATSMPAALYEVNFIHTLEGDAWFRYEANIMLAQTALCTGLLDYLAIPVFSPIEPPIEPPVVAEPSAAEQILEHAREIMILAEDL